jgi:hypothetical protein
MVERWNGGTVERWNGGTVERSNANQSIFTVQLKPLFARFNRGGYEPSFHRSPFVSFRAFSRVFASHMVPIVPAESGWNKRERKTRDCRENAQIKTADPSLRSG